jgi:16S rRNA G527 N7-methylase RsmG
MLDPRITVVLIERKTRKTAFLERVVVTAGVDGVEIAAADAGELARSERYRHTFDLVGMMAVTRPEEVADTVENLLADGGYFSAIRGGGSGAPPEKLGRLRLQKKTQPTSHGRVVIYQKPRS